MQVSYRIIYCAKNEICDNNRKHIRIIQIRIIRWNLVCDYLHAQDLKLFETTGKCTTERM